MWPPARWMLEAWIAASAGGMAKPEPGGGITSGAPETHSSTTVSPELMVSSGGIGGVEGAPAHGLGARLPGGASPFCGLLVVALQLRPGGDGRQPGCEAASRQSGESKQGQGFCPWYPIRRLCLLDLRQGRGPFPSNQRNRWIAKAVPLPRGPGEQRSPGGFQGEALILLASLDCPGGRYPAHVQTSRGRLGCGVSYRVPDAGSWRISEFRCA